MKGRMRIDKVNPIVLGYPSENFLNPQTAVRFRWVAAASRWTTSSGIAKIVNIGRPQAGQHKHVVKPDEHTRRRTRKALRRERLQDRTEGKPP